MINTDEQSHSSWSSPTEHRVRIKLFMDRQHEEMMPTLQYEGTTLIRQKIGFRCESDNPEYVYARGEVNDLEGFFCVMNFVRGNSAEHVQGMPKFVKISATAFASDVNGK